MKPRVHIEGYAIVSDDGMLADAAGVIPASLKIDADQRFFRNGLAEADVIVNGRNSQDQFPDSATRRRIILTRRISSLADDPSNGRAILWNPGGATFDEALAAISVPNESVAVIGGPEVFGLFLDLYDVFFLSRAAGVTVPGGRSIFRDPRTPESVLAAHGLENPRHELSEGSLTITGWRRPEV